MPPVSGLVEQVDGGEGGGDQIPQESGLLTSTKADTKQIPGTEAEPEPAETVGLNRTTVCVLCLLHRERPQRTRSYDNNDSAALLLSSSSRTENDEDVAQGNANWTLE